MGRQKVQESMTTTTLTPKQFDALITLLRIRPGNTQAVAREVLVKGRTVPEAAREVGIDYPQAYKAVQRARRGLELVQKVIG